MHTYVSWESGTHSTEHIYSDSSEIDEEVSITRKENVLISALKKFYNIMFFYGLYGPKKTHDHSRSINKYSKSSNRVSVFDSPSERRALEILSELAQLDRRKPSFPGKQQKQKITMETKDSSKFKENEYNLLSRISIVENNISELKERLEVIQISIDALTVHKDDVNQEKIVALRLEKDDILNDLERLEIEYITLRSKITTS